MLRPVQVFQAGPCRQCAYFCHRESRKQPFCAWTGERMSKGHVEAGCRGFYLRQHETREGGVWQASLQP